MVNEMRKIGNLDPSRDPGNGGNDRCAAGRDDPAALRRSADDGDWRPDAAGAAPDRGTPRRSSAGRDHSTCKSRKATGNMNCGKTSAGEQLPHEPPSARVDGL